MNRRWRYALSCLVPAMLPAVLCAEDVRVSGRVLDARDRPVKDAVVGATWTLSERRLEAKQALTTDREGEFAGTLRIPDNRPVALLAVDKPQERGGLIVLNPGEIGQPVTIKLERLVNVRGTFDTAALGPGARTIKVEILADPGNINLITTEWSTKTLALKLPPGAYDFWIICEGAERESREIMVRAGKPQLALDKIELKQDVIAAHVGKPPPPWNVTDARGVAKEVSLADFKGKWVLLEFWGFW